MADIKKISISGTEYDIVDAKALRIADQGLIMPNFDAMPIIATYEYDVSDTNWKQLFTRTNTETAQIDLQDIVYCRITVTGTNISSKYDCAFYWKGQLAPFQALVMSYPGNGDGNYCGIRYMIPVYPKALNNGYPWILNFQARNNTARHFKIEVFKTNSKITWMSTATGTTYNGTYHNSNSFTIDAQRGLCGNDTIYYGTVLQSGWASSVNSYMNKYTVNNTMPLTGEALLANQFTFMNGNKIYPATNKTLAVEPSYGITLNVTAYNNNVGVGWDRFRDRQRVTSLTNIPHATLSRGDNCYFRCTTDANGNIYSDNYVSNQMTAGYTWYYVGLAESNTVICICTSGSHFLTLDSNGKLTAVDGKLIAQQDLSGYVPTSRKINNKALTSDITLTASDVSALPSSTTINDLTTTAQQNALNSGITSTDVTQITTNKNNISTINGKIPSAATTTNQLADKSFVNSSISTNTAYFIGTFNSVADLEAYSGTLTNNDYAFVISTDSAGNTVYNRYKYTTATNPASWQFEYALNNSSFTADQWAAINSGATTTNIGQITTNQNAIGTLSSLTTTEKSNLVGAINELDSEISSTTGKVLDFYGTCDTAAATQTKDVVCTGFSLKTGASIRVKFTNYQNYNGVFKLNVNNTGAIEVKYNGTTNTGRYTYKAGEVVAFTYDGTYWVIEDGGIADTTYYGITKLAATATSTSAAFALTPSALNSYSQNTIANYPVYSTSSTYAVGDRVRYNYNTYECNTAITTAEAWTAAHWTALPDLQTQIDEKASTSLDNLSADGQMIVDSVDGKISNCILEIPQRLKIELVDGHPVIKAGSKIPMIGSTYSETTLTSDYTINFQTSWQESDGLIFYIPNSGYQQTWGFVAMNRTLSGDTLPTGLTGNTYLWFDTVNKVYKGTTDGGRESWTDVTVASYPLAAVHFKDGVVTEILKDSNGNDMIFNGTGFIGHHAFVYPDIEALTPRKINEDGTLKSTFVKNNNLAIIELNEGPYNGYNRRISMISGNPVGNSASYVEINDKSEAISASWVRQYVKNENVIISRTSTAGEIVEYVGGIYPPQTPLIEYNYDGTTVTLFNVRQPVRLATTEMLNDINADIESQLALKANDADVVHKTGNETIAGTKTFSSAIDGTINTTVAAGSTKELLRAKIADNDYFRLMTGGTSNAGYVELATADDYNEPIYVRQYQGGFTTVKRTATLLDGSGNTSFPGTVNANRVTANVLDGSLVAYQTHNGETGNLYRKLGEIVLTGQYQSVVVPFFYYKDAVNTTEVGYQGKISLRVDGTAGTLGTGNTGVVLSEYPDWINNGNVKFYVLYKNNTPESNQVTCEIWSYVKNAWDGCKIVPLNYHGYGRNYWTWYDNIAGVESLPEGYSQIEQKYGRMYTTEPSEDTTTSKQVDTVGARNTKLANYALDNNVVHKTSDETISGVKTFTQNNAHIVIKTTSANYSEEKYGQGYLHFLTGDNKETGYVNSYLVNATQTKTELVASWLGTNSRAILRLKQNEDGSKAAELFAPTEDTTSSIQIDTVGARNTKLASYALDANVVHKTGNETIAGVKTFSDNINANTSVTVGQHAVMSYNSTTEALEFSFV